MILALVAAACMALSDLPDQLSDSLWCWHRTAGGAELAIDAHRSCHRCRRAARCQVADTRRHVHAGRRAGKSLMVASARRRVALVAATVCSRLKHIYIQPAAARLGFSR